MALSDEQNAMLRLLASGEQGYDDIAALMGLSATEVRAKVVGALRQRIVFHCCSSATSPKEKCRARGPGKLNREALRLGDVGSEDPIWALHPDLL